MGEIDSLRNLAREAAREADKFGLRGCWPWSHRWTRWALAKTGRTMTRECMKCGLVKAAVIHRECQHEWRTFKSGKVETNGELVGHFYEQECTNCGDLREKRL